MMESAASLLLRLRVQIRAHELASSPSVRSLSFSPSMSWCQAGSPQSAPLPPAHHHRCSHHLERPSFYSPPLSAAPSPGAAYLASNSCPAEDYVPKYHSTALSHQFLLLAAATIKLSQLKELIADKYRKLYPHDEALQIQCLRDKNDCDLDEDYMAIEVFGQCDVVKVIRRREDAGAKEPEAYRTVGTLASLQEPVLQTAKPVQGSMDMSGTEQAVNILEDRMTAEEAPKGKSHDKVQDKGEGEDEDAREDENEHGHGSGSECFTSLDSEPPLQMKLEASVKPESKSESEAASYKSSSTEQEDSENGTDDEKPLPEARTDEPAPLLKRKFANESENERKSELGKQSSSDMDSDMDSDSDSDSDNDSNVGISGLELGKNTHRGPSVTSSGQTPLPKKDLAAADPSRRASTASPFLLSGASNQDRGGDRGNPKSVTGVQALYQQAAQKRQAADEENSTSSSSSSEDEPMSHRSLSSLPSLKSMKISKPSAPPPMVLTQKPSAASAKPATTTKPPAKRAYSAAIFSPN